MGLIMNHNSEEVGVALEVKSPKNHPQFSQMTMGQYWLGKTKLSDQPEMLSKSCHRILITFYLMEFLLTD